MWGYTLCTKVKSFMLARIRSFDLFVTILLVLLTMFLKMEATGSPLTVTRSHDVFLFWIIQNSIDLSQAHHYSCFGNCHKNYPCIAYCTAMHGTSIQSFLWFNSLIYGSNPYHLPPAIFEGTLHEPGGLCIGRDICQLLSPHRTWNKCVWRKFWTRWLLSEINPWIWCILFLSIPFPYNVIDYSSYSPTCYY